MKNILIFLVIFFNTMCLFSQTKALICTDNLRVRNAPTVNSTIVKTYNFGEIVYIYEERGRQLFINGIYDYWYRISENENHWVNSLYVNIFPFYINNAVYTNTGILSYLKILDIYIKNGNRYILCEKKYTSRRNDDFELSLFRTFTDEDDYLPVIDNFSNRVYEFANSVLKHTNWDNKQYNSTLTYKITNSNLIFSYGINIGYNMDQLQQILGLPFLLNSNILQYKAFTENINIDIFLYHTNNKLSKIVLNVLMKNILMER